MVIQRYIDCDTSGLGARWDTTVQPEGPEKAKFISGCEKLDLESTTHRAIWLDRRLVSYKDPWWTHRLGAAFVHDANFCVLHKIKPEILKLSLNDTLNTPVAAKSSGSFGLFTSSSGWFCWSILGQLPLAETRLKSFLLLGPDEVCLNMLVSVQNSLVHLVGASGHKDPDRGAEHTLVTVWTWVVDVSDNLQPPNRWTAKPAEIYEPELSFSQIQGYILSFFFAFPVFWDKSTWHIEKRPTSYITASLCKHCYTKQSCHRQ